MRVNFTADYRLLRSAVCVWVRAGDFRFHTADRQTDGRTGRQTDRQAGTWTALHIFSLPNKVGNA